MAREVDRGEVCGAIESFVLDPKERAITNASDFESHRLVLISVSAARHKTSVALLS